MVRGEPENVHELATTSDNGRYTSAVDPEDFKLPIRDKRLLLPQKVCALVFGVSPQAVQQWPVEAREKKGRISLYYLPDLAAYRDFHASKQRPLMLEAERARLAAAQADRTEIELDTLRKELIPASEVAATWQPIAGAIRQKVLALPSKLKTAIPTLKDKDLAKAITNEGL